MTYEDFNDTIKKRGEETALHVGSPCDNWLQFNVQDLAPPIDERNHLLHALCSTANLPPSIIDAMQIQQKRLTKHAKDKVLKAKAK